MEISLQLFGGRGVSSGGNTNFVGHSMPNTWKPNSSRTRYDQNGSKREKRYFDQNGDKERDVHYKGPPNHEYPHEHYWYKDKEGNWHRTPYEYWKNGGRGWKK